MCVVGFGVVRGCCEWVCALGGVVCVMGLPSAGWYRNGDRRMPDGSRESRVQKEHTGK